MIRLRFNFDLNRCLLKRVKSNVHAAGLAVRLRVSNRFGTEPVTLGAVSIGVSGGDAALGPNGALPLTFDGQPGLTLAQGESRLSDSVALAVEPMQRLAISLYVPGKMVSGSRHFSANEYVWRAEGNQTAQPDGASFKVVSSPLVASSVLIEALEVLPPADSVPPRVLVAFGDSITDGFVSANGVALVPSRAPIGLDVRYPDFLQRRLLAAGQSVTVVNAGLSGNRLLAGPLLPMLGPSGLSRLDQDVLQVAGVTDVLVLIGINDLGFTLSPSATGPKVQAGLISVVQRVKAAGLRAIVGTLTPARGTSFGLGHGSAAVESARQAINQWVRTSGVPDAVVDFDACLSDPSRPDRLRAELDSGDHLHPNAAGYKVMADCVDLSLLR